jgi:hypothetical protein
MTSGEALVIYLAGIMLCAWVLRCLLVGGDEPAQGYAEAEGLKYAVVRSRDQGVMAGFVKSIDGRRVTLLRARQLWRISCAFVLTDLATKGTTSRWENKFSCEAEEPTEMLEACGVLYCTDKARDAIRAVPAQTPGEED